MYTPSHPDTVSVEDASAQRHIGLLLFDGVEELDAVGPWEV
jgi:transcriptional regulator GlxA family with amidase domain